MEFGRHWGGGEHFGISKCKGVKMFMLPLVGYGYFLESLINKEVAISEGIGVGVQSCGLGNHTTH